MFKVISKINRYEYDIYGVSKEGNTTWFLTYFTGGWHWISSDLCELTI